MKYFLAQIDERNGEYEYAHTIFLKCKPETKPDDALNDIAKFWYDADEGGSDDYENGKYWSHNGGEVCTYAGKFEEIPESVFNDLKFSFLTTFER